MAARKRLQIGDLDFAIDESTDGGQPAEEVIENILTAMEQGTSVRVEVLDNNDRRLSLLLNGNALPAVVIDLGLGGRGEPSG